MTPVERYEEFKDKKPKKLSKKFLLFAIPTLILTNLNVIVLFFMLFFRSAYYKKKIDKYNQQHAGYLGEAIGQMILEDLAEEYDLRLFSNIQIEETNAEMDFVLLGDNFVKIIEVKHLLGYLVGDEDSKYWYRTKTSSGGEEYTSEYYSPIKQVKTHAYKLKEYLNKYSNVSPWIDCGVLFTEDSMELFVDSELIYFRDAERRLREFVKKKLKSNKKYELKEHLQIANHLRTLGEEIKV